jgi:tyrosinase
MAELRHAGLTRRGFLSASAATLAATALPSATLAQGATYRRFDISDPNLPPRVLDSYKNAIRAMLALPPTDPHNWYRNAFVHTLDCPHGNWWFLVWHRAYLGWFERTCRERSGDPDFALPYWDWTKTPRIPAAMFDDVLDPNNSAYIDTFEHFKKSFEGPVEDLWGRLTTPQKEQVVRRFKDSGAFWHAIWHPDDPERPPMFFERGAARGLTASNPDFDEDTKSTVLHPMIEMALREPIFAGIELPKDRAGFGSAKNQNHLGGDEDHEGILETGPHDNVHGGVAGPDGVGFMISYLSPVDPIFFLHHANIDRLWDVWTRRQLLRDKPTLPEGADLTAWSSEQFLFFTDEKRQPVSKTNAGDYAAMSVFDYDYKPGGSYEDMIPLPPRPVVVAAPRASQRFSASVSSQAIRPDKPGGGAAEVPGDLLQPSGPETPPRLIEVTLNLTPADQRRRFRVLVSLPGGNPIDIGTIRPFGPHAVMGPMKFTVPLPENLGAAAGTNVALDIRVVSLEEPKVAPGKGMEMPKGVAPGEAMKPPMGEAPGMQTPMGAAPQVTAITAIQVRTN